MSGKLEEMFNLNRPSFDSRLKGNKLRVNFLFGQEKLSEVNGKPAEVLSQSLKRGRGVIRERVYPGWDKGCSGAP